MRQIQEYIRGHYAERFTSEEIEKLCGLSYKYAGTLFKNYTAFQEKKLIGLEPVGYPVLYNLHGTPQQIDRHVKRRRSVRMVHDAGIRKEFERLLDAHVHGNIPQASVHLWQIFLTCARNVQEDTAENAYVRQIQFINI